MKTNLKLNRSSWINRFAVCTIALTAAIWASCSAGESAADRQRAAKAHESTDEVAKTSSAKLNDDQQQAIDFAKKYSGARPTGNKNGVLRGVREVQLKIVLVTPESKATLSESKVVGAATQTLNSAGVRVVESDSAPFLVLSVDTVDNGSALSYNVRLELIETVTISRHGEFLKTVVTSWSTSQFGAALQAEAGHDLSTAVLKVLNKFADGLREGN